MQIIKYLVLTCTWSFEIQKYLVLTCTWRQKYLVLVQVLKYFCQINKYSVLNLWICSLQQFATEHHNQNYWNGSYWVCWQHWSQDVKTGLSPWFTGQALTQYGDKILVITGSGSSLSPVRCKPLQPTWYIVNWTLWTLWSAGSESILTYWGMVTPYSDKILVTIGSGNDLSPVQCQAIACRVGSIQCQNWNCSSIQIPEQEMELKLKMELEILEF